MAGSRWPRKRTAVVSADGVPVKVVSERLRHASATITLAVYQHVHPGMGRQAADRFAALLEG
jgi:integrase